MKLLAIPDRGKKIVELGRDLTFATAYEFILKNDTDFDNPKWPNHDLVLVDGDEKWAFEMGSWIQIK